MVNTDSTSNINIFGGQQMTAEDFAAISKMAVEQAEQTKKLQKIQQKALDDKVAQLKGESEAEQRARKLREARDFAQKEYEDQQIAEYEKKIKRQKDVNAQEESLQKLEDENYQKEKNIASGKLKNTSIVDVLPDNIKNIKQQDESNDSKKNGLFSKLNEGYKQITEVFKNANKQKNDGEQKDLGGNINRVSFNPEGIKILKTLLIPLYTGLNVGALEGKLKDLAEGQKEVINNTKPKSSLLETLGKLLLVGGVAATLVGLFWPKIKGFLEEKFGVKLDFLDKFRGIVEGIGKFFVMGGLKITFGGAFKIVGGVIKSFGELIETGLTAAFKGLFSGGGAAAVEGGAEIASKGGGLFKGLLPKIAAGLFKGLGATVLKGIPVIGGLISFGFAISRFKSGDWVGGIIDLIGGIANICDLIPGAAAITVPISLGATALNAFLDLKAGGGPNSNQKKLGAIGNLFVGLWNLLKKIPVIGTVLTFAEGTGQFFTSLVTGDLGGMKTGLEKMGQMPILGLAVAPLLALFDSVKTDSQGKISGFDTGSIWKNLKMRVGKTILSWFDWLPKSWQKGIADLMGVPFEGGTDDENGSDAGTSAADKALASKKAKLADFNLAYGEKGGNSKERAELENAVKNAEIESNKEKPADQLNNENYKKLKDDYENKKIELEKYEKDFGDSRPEEHKQKQEELEKAKKSLEVMPSVIAQPAPVAQSYQPSPVEVPQNKQDDQQLKEMRESVIKTNIYLQKYHQMWIDTAKPNMNQTPTTVINNSSQVSQHDDAKDYLMKPVRDTNYDKKMSWYGNSLNYRATLP